MDNFTYIIDGKRWNGKFYKQARQAENAMLIELEKYSKNNRQEFTSPIGRILKTISAKTMSKTIIDVEVKEKE